MQRIRFGKRNRTPILKRLIHQGKLLIQIDMMKYVCPHNHPCFNGIQRRWSCQAPFRPIREAVCLSIFNEFPLRSTAVTRNPLCKSGMDNLPVPAPKSTTSFIRLMVSRRYSVPAPHAVWDEEIWSWSYWLRTFIEVFFLGSVKHALLPLFKNKNRRMVVHRKHLFIQLLIQDDGWNGNKDWYHGTIFHKKQSPFSRRIICYKKRSSWGIFPVRSEYFPTPCWKKVYNNQLISVAVQARPFFLCIRIKDGGLIYW